MSRDCLCVSYLCAVKVRDDRIVPKPCLNGCRKIDARRVVGLMPEITDSTDIVVLLLNPPTRALRLILKQGALLHYLPTRAPVIFRGDYIVAFTLMTEPSVRILESTIIEIHGADQKKLVEEMSKIYGKLIIVDLREIEHGKIESNYFKVYWKNDDKREIIFEAKIWS